MIQYAVNLDRREILDAPPSRGMTKTTAPDLPAELEAALDAKIEGFSEQLR